jgi:hypothetical protein
MSLFNVSTNLETTVEAKLTWTGTSPLEECLNIPPSAVAGICPDKDGPEYFLKGVAEGAVAWVLPSV